MGTAWSWSGRIGVRECVDDGCTMRNVTRRTSMRSGERRGTRDIDYATPAQRDIGHQKADEGHGTLTVRPLVRSHVHV